MTLLKLLPRLRRRRTGFTLIELLVVLVILGLLAMVAVPQVLRYVGHAKTETARVSLRNIASTLDFYRLDVGRYPTQQEGLQALMERPAGLTRWNGPYLKSKDMILDPWGRIFTYRIPGQHGEYDLYSLGADNAPGGEKENQDITNW